MATFRRALIPGGMYFFTAATWQRQKLLTEPEVLAALRAALLLVRVRYPFEIDAQQFEPGPFNASLTPSAQDSTLASCHYVPPHPSACSSLAPTRSPPQPAMCLPSFLPFALR